MKLLVSVRAETQDLQEKKEQLQTELVDLNKAVDETKSEVRFVFSPFLLNITRFCFVVYAGRIQTKTVLEQ